MSVPRFFAPGVDPAAGALWLSPDESHHAEHVLRVAVGADVRVFDGAGREWAGRVSSMRRSATCIDLLGEVTPVAEPPACVTLAIGVLKGGQMDAVVRDATMLGAAAIVPLATAHLSAGKKKTRVSGGHWRRIAIASAKQCGRAVVPVVEESATLPDLLERGGFAVTVMLVEPSVKDLRVTSLAEAAGPKPASALVLIGPEGGWSTLEVALAVDRGARLATLGPRTLRAETAPIVALGALWTCWGW